ncbi:MAG: tetratricopeptide repeat protein [Chloroflexales bacterium]
MQGLASAAHVGNAQSESILANNLGRLYLGLGLYDQARADADAAVRLARARDDDQRLGTFLITLGRAYSGMGQHELARETLREAYTLAKSCDDHATVAHALISFAAGGGGAVRGHHDA